MGGLWWMMFRSSGTAVRKRKRAGGICPPAEILEVRTLLSPSSFAPIAPLTHGDPASPNDRYFSELWGMEKIAAEEAWDQSTGRTEIVVAGIDTGIDYTHSDLHLNIWVNQGEIPQSALATWQDQGVDVHGDGLLTFWDLNEPRNRALRLVADVDLNGRIDGRDVLAPALIGGWADGVNNDGNGFTFSDPDLGTWTIQYTDDLIGWDFANEDNDPMDDNGHGTHTAGTIAAVGDNERGVAGVNWQVQIMPLKFMNALGVELSTQNAVEALYYAGRMGARASNNSWGGVGFGRNDTSDPLYRAIKDVGERFNHLVVAAAGNNGANNDDPEQAMYPASYDLPNIISVAATDENDDRSWFSNYGKTTVDLGAPGEGILSTFTSAGAPLDSYVYFSGTSMAAPHVTGAVALVWSVRPGLDDAQVKDLILRNVDPVASLSDITVSGGRLNVARAVQDAADERPDGKSRGRGREFGWDRGRQNAGLVEVAVRAAILVGPVWAVDQVPTESSPVAPVRAAPDWHEIANLLQAPSVAAANATDEPTSQATGPWISRPDWHTETLPTGLRDLLDLYFTALAEDPLELYLASSGEGHTPQ